MSTSYALGFESSRKDDKVNEVVVESTAEKPRKHHRRHSTGSQDQHRYSKHGHHRRHSHHGHHRDSHRRHSHHNKKVVSNTVENTPKNKARSSKEEEPAKLTTRTISGGLAKSTPPNRPTTTHVDERLAKSVAPTGYYDNTFASLEAKSDREEWEVFPDIDNPPKTQEVGLAKSTPPNHHPVTTRVDERLTKSTPVGYYDNTIASLQEESDTTVDFAELSDIENQPKATHVVAVGACMASEQPKGTGGTTTESVYAHAELEPRQGQKCCGCCCDYRRAVIIVNIIIIILEALLLILVVTGVVGNIIYGGGSQSGESFMKKYETIEMIFSAISIVLCGVAIAGAILYSSIMVGLNALWLLAGYVVGLFLAFNACSEWDGHYEDGVYYTCSVNGIAIITSGVVMICWIYPHVGFIVQVQKGIMSKETYRREEFSCCCV